jgi:AmiR/NasT family two-component response regulator
MREKVSRNGGASAGALEELATLRAENLQLRDALETRVILEQAKGAISARCGVSPEDAFEMMRGLARSQRRDIHEYAAEIVSNGGRFSADE